MIAPGDVAAPMPDRAALLVLLGTPDLASKRWAWQQYDHLIGGNTIVGPGGADAAVVRVEDGPKGLALVADVTPRYCAADPVAGGRQAVAEAWRNLTAVGALPLALTDNLNFGNPEKPEAMGELVGCIRGIGEAARALDFPIVSGNVSLYNETGGRGILPTPTIGGVGLVDDVARIATSGFKAAGEAVLLVGETKGWLGQSLYLRDICGRGEGAPPPVDLEAERRNGDLVRRLIRAGSVTAVHDLSDGGLAVGLAEMTLARGIGVVLDASTLADLPSHAALFGEDQGRYLLSCTEHEAGAILAARGSVPIGRIGTTGGTALILPGSAPIEVAEIRRVRDAWMPDYMGRAAE